MQQARADFAVMKMVDLTPSANVGHKSQKPLVLCDFMGTWNAERLLRFVVMHSWWLHEWRWGEGWVEKGPERL